jgi:DNA polymerase-3 subunit beta
MEILVKRNDLATELSLVQGIVERKNSIPILSNVLCEAKNGELRISATDLDVSLRCGCPAEVKQEGAVTLGAKKLYEIVRSLPESEMKLTLEDDAWARIKCGRVEFRMAGLPREDFPSLPEPKSARGIEIPAALLKELIQRTAFAITAEDARYYLAGALLLLEKEKAAMVATDGHRLAWAERKTQLKVADTTRVLVPRKAITEIARLIEQAGAEEAVSFQQGDGHLIFGIAGRTLASKQVEAQFPAFEKVIAVAGDKKVSLAREALQSAIRRVSLLSSDRGRAVRLGTRRRQARALRLVARARRGARGAQRGLRGRQRRDRLQRAIPARVPGRRRQRAGAARAQGLGEPGAAAAGERGRG